MLARVAENMYWMSRYIERAEDMARLVNVNTNLLLDLPKGIAPGWRPLVTIIGAERAFAGKYGEKEDETRVLRFLIADRENSQSILSSLGWARENARTFRDAIPREAWEEINGLHHFARDNVQAGLTKRGRFDYLAGVIRRVQTITGVLAGCMSHDEGYAFIQIGRQLERADMITRILDVRTAGLIPEKVSALGSFENIQWMSVLKSLTGYQMYRLEKQVSVQRTEVLRFLLQSPRFPRSVLHCLDELASRLESLGPQSEAPLRTVHRLQRLILETDMETLSQERLHEFIDELQVGFAEVHTAIDAAFFHRKGEHSTAA
ncbi:MAG: alpha-E domain-containing protein [Gammaproteobacteria bacterium]|nr:alpha-E domain-containing protein [Gammaproteobacteria bacterium]